METRKSYWYSIIKYIADFTKGEPLNIGIFIENEEHNFSKYFIIDADNVKLKSVFENRLESDIYKYGKDYFEYLMEKIHKNEYPLNSSNSSLINFLMQEKELPNGFLFSEPQFAKTENLDNLFDNLKMTYIGKRFIDNYHSSRNLIIKERTNSIFTEADLLNKKIKTNVRISPSPSLPFKYQIDYAYRVNDKIDLIHTAPENIDLLSDWFEKMNVFSTKYTRSDKISLLYDSSVDETLLSDTQSVIRLLTDSDNRVEAIDINAQRNGISSLISNIQSNALSIETLDELIAI